MKNNDISKVRVKIIMNFSRKLRVIGLSSVLILLTLQGYSQHAENCLLLKEDIGIHPENYPACKKELEEFYSGKHSYDLLYIKIIGGRNSSGLKRVFYNENKWQFSTRKLSSDSTLTVDISENLKNMFDNMHTGQYNVFCCNDISTNTYIYLIRSNGSFFKFVSFIPYYEFSEMSEIQHITGSVKLIEYIECK